MPQRRAIIIAMSLILCLRGFAQLETPSEETEKITLNEAKAMGKAASDEVTAIYLETGIEAALQQADILYAELQEVPAESLAPDIRASSQKPDGSMYFALWREAQVGTGNRDPLWALEIFKWLDRQNELKRGSKPTKRIGPLVSNLYHNMLALGRLGEAHLLVNEMAQSLLDAGIDIETSNLADLGPWNAKLPQLRKRTYRLKAKDNPSHYFGGYYNFTYFLTMNDIADYSYRTGNWQRAGELAIWVRQYANAFTRDYPKAGGSQGFEPKQCYVQNSNRLAHILHLSGQPELAVEILEEAISRGFNTYNQRSEDYARMYRESLLLELGQSDKESVKRAEVIFERYKNNRFSPESGIAKLAGQYALLLEHHAQTNAAWSIIEQTENSLGSISKSAANQLRLAKIKLSLNAENYEHVERWLIESLNYSRSKGLKIDEPALYELYAAFQAAKGNYAAASRLSAEAHRTYRSLGLHHAAQSNFGMLMSYRNEALTNTIAQAETPSEPKAIDQIDLQPLTMNSVSLLNQKAFGRFALSNPTPNAVTGTLTIAGVEGDLTWDSETNSCDFNITSNTPLTQTHTFELLPNDQMHIRLTADSPDTTDRSIKLIWQTADNTSISATWTYSSAARISSIAFINASYLQDNPFYLVPLFQMLQSRPVSYPTTHNFRYQASVPTRLEVYSSESGELICIDANGDGDFIDSGDQLTQDHDKNGYPDITLLSGQGNYPIETYFRIQDGTSGERVQLNLDLLQGEEWETQSINFIDL